MVRNGEKEQSYQCGHLFSLCWSHTWYNVSVFLPGEGYETGAILCPKVGVSKKVSNDMGIEGWVRFLQVERGTGNIPKEGRWKFGEKFRPGKVA